ncbi:MAG TPA: trimeric intracellular cation channel family protein [Hyphomicrobiaceae bacterium]|nr:trimeric intracellular cation channel family protein [Hyphomicrobiaceae bacterium]
MDWSAIAGGWPSWTSVLETLTTLLPALDLTAAVVFAVTGALVASRKQMDIVGFMWLGVVTGVGGGTVRDVLLDLPVFWVHDPTPVAACIVASAVTYFTAHLVQSRYRLLLWLDAIGLALVTMAGTAKALDHGAGPIVAVVMGVITAALGGIIRDVLGHEPSIILRREIYVTASLAGAIAYVALVGGAVSKPTAALAGGTIAFTVRGLALLRGWSLPTYRSRPGRPAENAGCEGKADP